MIDAWMPAARRLWSRIDGGPLLGGAPRVVWQTTECDPGKVSAHSAAERLDHLGRPPHLVWHPVTGELAQLLPANRAGRALRLDPAHDGPATVHREGRVCLQIFVVGYAREPFTDYPMAGLDAIMTWLDSWNVARDWPAGPPADPTLTARGHRRQWARGGHFAAAQVPCCDLAGPGAIDVEKITGRGAAPVALPLPRVPEPDPRPRPRVRANGQVTLEPMR